MVFVGEWIRDKKGGWGMKEGMKVRVVEGFFAGKEGVVLGIYAQEYPVECRLCIDGVGWTQSDFKESQLIILEEPV